MATTKSCPGNTDAPTVLFVDDEPDILEIYPLLCNTNYNVLTLSDPEEALDKFDDTIDFAFFDRRMPGKTGDELIKELRNNGYDTQWQSFRQSTPTTMTHSPVMNT